MNGYKALNRTTEDRNEWRKNKMAKPAKMQQTHEEEELFLSIILLSKILITESLKVSGSRP